MLFYIAKNQDGLFVCRSKLIADSIGDCIGTTSEFLRQQELVREYSMSEIYKAVMAAESKATISQDGYSILNMESFT